MMRHCNLHHQIVPAYPHFDFGLWHPLHMWRYTVPSSPKDSKYSQLRWNRRSWVHVDFFSTGIYYDCYFQTWALCDIAVLRLIPIPRARNSTIHFFLWYFSAAFSVARSTCLAAGSPWFPLPFAVGWKEGLHEVISPTHNLINAYLGILLISCRLSCYFGHWQWRQWVPKPVLCGILIIRKCKRRKWLPQHRQRHSVSSQWS